MNKWNGKIFNDVQRKMNKYVILSHCSFQGRSLYLRIIRIDGPMVELEHLIHNRVREYVKQQGI